MDIQFKKKKVEWEKMLSIYLPSREVKDFCEILSKATGVNVYLVGGAIRQLVRNICWKGETPTDVVSFMQHHLRDRDVLISGKVAIPAELVDSLWSPCGLPKGETPLDVITLDMNEYAINIDWHSNSVFYDGENLYFLPLKEGEDYLNESKEADENYLLLRGWINHHPMRGFECFEGTMPKVESFKCFYFSVYLEKLVALSKLYDKNEMLVKELKFLLREKLITKAKYLFITKGENTLAYWFEMNKEVIFFVIYLIAMISTLSFFFF